MSPKKATTPVTDEAEKAVKRAEKAIRRGAFAKTPPPEGQQFMTSSTEVVAPTVDEASIEENVRRQVLLQAAAKAFFEGHPGDTWAGITREEAEAVDVPAGKMPRHAE